MTNIDEVVSVWTAFLKSLDDWRILIENIKPEINGCGLVYALANPINRPKESIAIADMSKLQISEPHYHPNETEIYIVLQGSGLAIVGGKVQKIEEDSVVITESKTSHFTVPEKDLVLAVINTPPFKPENYIVVTKTNPNVGFDQEQFEKLSLKTVTKVL